MVFCSVYTFLSLVRPFFFFFHLPVNWLSLRMLVLALAKLVTFHEDPCQLYLISLYLKMSELQNRAFAWNADAHTLAPGFKGWGEKPCSLLTLWSSAWHLSGSSSLRDFKLTLVPLGFVLRTRQEFFFFFQKASRLNSFNYFWAPEL